MREESFVQSLKKILAALFMTGTLPATTVAQQDQRSTRFALEDVFQLEFASDPQIAPDGSQIVLCGTSWTS